MFTWALLVVLFLITPFFQGSSVAFHMIPEKKRYAKPKLPTPKSELILNYVCAVPLIAVYLSLGSIPGSRLIFGIALLLLSSFYIIKIIRSIGININISFLIGFSLYSRVSKIAALFLMILFILVALESLNMISTAVVFYDQL